MSLTDVCNGVRCWEVYFESPGRITSFPYSRTWRLERASCGSLSVLLRERETPSDRQVSGQVPGSGNIWIYAAINVHLHVFRDSFKRRMVFGKVGDRFTSWEDLKRSMMLRLSEQVRWSLRLFHLVGDQLSAFRRLYRHCVGITTAYNDLTETSPLLLSKVFRGSYLLVTTFFFFCKINY